MPRTAGVYAEPAGTKGTPNTTIQSAPYNAFIDDLVADANAARPVTAGGTGSTTASGARTNLGLVIGTNVQAYDADLTALASITIAANQIPYGTGAATWGVTTLSAYGRTLIDDADAAAARTTLGLVIGTNVQAFDADLTAFAAVTIAANQIAYGTGAATWGVTSLTAFARTILDDADAATVRTTIGAQASAATLTAIAGLAVTNGNIIVGDGTTWVAESGATARTSLGLGTMATQNATAVAITGGSVAGITDLAVADGGTGASTAAAARANLGLDRFVSAQQTITLGSSSTIAHGLGAMPSNVVVELVCTTADQGYSVNDVVQYGTHSLNVSGVGGLGGTGIEKNATNVILRYPQTQMTVINKSTNVAQPLTPGSWRAVVRAYE
ncbi:hypothetical protein PMI07_002360 [Rhizobium sp. CF080]|uniref:hypothetical protein n=1 Tax=Rhizobium sp. (strain CF080) TaxID=1144310 RepID=UPI0002717810|nr:hypothetical protein [Rhizobium sp. CF080]EUB95872.1 hypothetical protein PMI07_002360 [Rhizobium sp. CF080]